MATLFFSYSHVDEALRDELEKHLTMLKREGAITTWHDRRIVAGTPIDSSIDEKLEAADIILLLVSVDFLSSEYCYSREMARALERHDAEQARVIPVILRPCEWKSAPIGRLRATPPDGKAVTKWVSHDDAFLEIAKDVRAAVDAIDGGTPAVTSSRTRAPRASVTLTSVGAAGPRSSNLRMRREFTERERDAFLDESFEYMARFFENTLAELQARQPGIEGAFKRLDATKFTGAIYRTGAAIARCTIRLGGMFGPGITISLGQHSENSANESLSVKEDEQSLYLKPMGFGSFGNQDRNSKLSQAGAAEYYWSMFFEPLQR